MKARSSPSAARATATPFAVLGVHADAAGRRWLRAFLPGAERVQARAPDGRTVLAALEQRHADGFFEGPYPQSAATDYRLHATWKDGSTTLFDDPYRFGPGARRDGRLADGRGHTPATVRGARRDAAHDGRCGRHQLRGVGAERRRASASSATSTSGTAGATRCAAAANAACVEIFLPGVTAGARYKYEIRSRDGHVLPLKADPFALQAELRPATASIVSALPEPLPRSEERRKANALDAPISVYEVHLGSWKRRPEDGDRWLTWDELADELVPYAARWASRTWNCLPVSEHPFDGSWGYQPVGLYAPTARFGGPEGFRRFVDRCHASGIGLILDWVPAHFPSDAHGLAQFDGTPLYEHADPREGFHQDWNTLIYDFGRTEVRNFLVGNALFWLERLRHRRPARRCGGLDALIATTAARPASGCPTSTAGARTSRPSPSCAA